MQHPRATSPGASFATNPPDQGLAGFRLGESSAIDESGGFAGSLCSLDRIREETGNWIERRRLNLLDFR